MATKPVARRTTPTITRMRRCRAAASGADVAEAPAPADGAGTVPAEGATGSVDEKRESGPTATVRAGFVRRTAVVGRGGV